MKLKNIACMKLKNIACIASVLLASLAGVKAATLTAWTFDNLSIGFNSSPSPSTGFGTAIAVGLGSTSHPDVQGLAGSSTGASGTNAWRVRGTSGIGWSTNAAIGAQGAQFSGSTAGYYKVKVSFDVYTTADAEANLLVQYTTEGTIWHNATVTSVGSGGTIQNNTLTNSTVSGSYVSLSSGWNNQIVVDLSGVSGVDNNSSFAVRLVNASTSTNNVTTTGVAYNNTSGDWTFDNVVIQGTAIDTIADWTFESYGANGYVPNPVPEFNVSSYAFAQALGFSNQYAFSDGSVGSSNAPDTTPQAGSSTPSGTTCWRVRGVDPAGNGSKHNGWSTLAPIGTQGGEFDVSTVNYSNVLINFDLYFTTQGEAKMCVLYTTNSWTNTFVANNLYYPPNPTFIVTNNPSDLANYSPNTVSGTYFYQTTGQNWYNNLLVDFTGVPGVDNNPNFGIRVVNAATGGDCVAFNGGSYNNSSGNCRFDNVTVGGQFEGLVPPVLNYAANASVDAPFTNTFSPDSAAWRAAITTVYVNGSALTNTAYATKYAGQIAFYPSNSVLLQSSGVKSIVITATGYSTAKVTQPVNAGVAVALAITAQPAAPSASGGTLVANPVLTVSDKYGNATTNPYANVTVTASPGGTPGWTLGGSTNQASVGGVLTFTNLSASVNGSTVVSGAAITFTVTGYGAGIYTTNSTTFKIGAPPAQFTRGNLAVIQLDSAANANNTTFSIIEVKPSAANQTSPANIIPVSATGTNALRQVSAATAGRLALSEDGTLITFAAFADNSAATADETLNLNRAAAGINYTNLLTIGLTYTSVSLGGSQARAAATLDNVNFFVDDKGGLYYGNTFLANPNLNSYNNVVVKTFGGVPYAETQKTANGTVIPAVYKLGFDTFTGLYDTVTPNNLTTDPVAADFYIVSTNVLYILDATSSSLATINKYSWAAGADPSNPDGQYGWNYNGTFTNGLGGDSLFATTNGNGGVYLYYTTLSTITKSTGNGIIRLTDTAGYNAAISITSSNLIYTAPTNTFIKGLTFVPQQTAYATELVPPPILTAQASAPVSSTFTVTNTPDDPAWRSAITGITVNGTTLSPTAYTTNSAGKLVFDPSKSPLLQSPGAKTIVISAAGYSTNSISQTLAVGAAAQLVITTQPKAPLGDGGILTNQPVVVVKDTYGNIVTNIANITAAAVQNTWTLGGTTTVATTTGTGTATYSGLTAFSTNAVTGATISFTSGALSTTSSTFNIPAPFKSTLGGVRIVAGKLTFSFTNFPGLSYSVIATNNIAAPVSTWPVVGSAVEGPSGTYNYTNTTPATNGSLFYLLRQP
jgi:hypothetical protein